MKRLPLILLLWGSSVFTLAADAQQPSEPPLTNASVVKLVKAGFKEKTVIAIINNRPSVFNLEPDQLIQLKRAGVSERIILAMLSSQDSTFIINGDELSDDAFFKGWKKPNNGDSTGSGADLFGSGSSSQSQSRSRGGQGGNQSEGNVTGSATVRILKPPTEGGAASTKLEKTPTLTNDGIIRLVEAGFSEGTIIKRIEESPVAFDLSPVKLEELHKRRVTDPIIAAMAAAMGGDAKP